MDSTPAEHPRSLLAWRILRLVLALETLGGAYVLVNVIRGFFAAGDDPVGAKVSLLLAVVFAFAWLLITCVAAFRSRASWVRGSALTIHVLMFAAATGVLQGLLGPLFGLGLALLVLSLVGFIAAIVARPDLQEIPEGDEGDEDDKKGQAGDSAGPAARK